MGTGVVGGIMGVELILIGGVATGIAGIIAGSRYQRRRDLAGERWLRFWKSRFGKWFSKLAGLGVNRLPGASAPAYRRTELAIGLAADRLYEDLPRPSRKALKDLPHVVRRLETQAQGMRARIATMEATPARDAEQRRLADTIAALETIRLQLLRMHAGVATMESLTADLSAARDVADQVDHRREGRREVEDAPR